MRRTALITVFLLLALIGSASADRLGGAYRGPAVDETIVDLDVAASWPYFYEHNREWILADRITARRRLARGGRSAPSAELVDRIFPVLLRATEDPVAQVRDAAILALGKTGREQADFALRMALRDDDPELREDALLALGLLGNENARGSLHLGLERGRFIPWSALGMALAGDTGWYADLLQQFHEQYGEENGGEALILAVAAGHLLKDESAVDEGEFAVLLKREDPGRSLARAGVCHALGTADLKACRPWLLRAIKDESDEVRAAAVLAMGAPGNMGELRALLGKSVYFSRMAAIYAPYGLAAGFGAPYCVEKVVDYAAKPAKNTYRAQHAAIALGLTGSRRANDFFLEELNEKRCGNQARSAMAMALGFTGDLRGKAALEKIVRTTDDPPGLRGYAAQALALMGSEKSLPVIRSALATDGVDPAFVTIATWALGLMGTEYDVPLLLDFIATKDDDWLTARGAAAIALGLIGAEESIEPLIKLAGTAKDPATRAFAIVALGWIVDRDPVPRIPLLFRKINYRLDSKIFREVMRIL